MSGINTLSALRNEDKLRLKNAARKVSSKYRERRKSLRFDKKRKHPDSMVCKAGSFGLAVEPGLQKKQKPTIKQGSIPNFIQKKKLILVKTVSKVLKSVLLMIDFCAIQEILKS